MRYTRYSENYTRQRRFFTFTTEIKTKTLVYSADVAKYKTFEILLKPKINTNMVGFCHGTVYILIISKRIFFQNVAVMGKTQKVFSTVQNINS